MRKIEHIGIAVKDMQAATKIYSSLLGYAHYKTEQVASEGVNTAFFTCGDSKIELLEATSNESAIAKFIAKKGEGVHHIAFAVDDIKKEVSRLEKEGFEVGVANDGEEAARNVLPVFSVNVPVPLLV